MSKVIFYGYTQVIDPVGLQLFLLLIVFPQRALGSCIFDRYKIGIFWYLQKQLIEPRISYTFVNKKLMAKTDIKNREDIEILINNFYEKLLLDKDVGFIFTKVAKINLEEHLPILCDFWQGILFQSSPYKRNAMQAHLDLHQKYPLTKTHFERWLKLFDATVDELFEGQKAHQAKVRALSIATVIQMKINGVS